MPNIGTETIGATPRQVNGNARGISVTMTEDGTLSSITAYLSDTGTGDTFGAAIYDSGGNRLQTSTTRTDISTAGWYTFTGFTQALTNTSSYYIVAGSGDSAANAFAYHDAGTGYLVTITGTITWPATNDFGANSDARQYSIYATYTTAGGSNHHKRLTSLGVG
jgi:hypothetical protein